MTKRMNIRNYLTRIIAVMTVIFAVLAFCQYVPVNADEQCEDETMAALAFAEDEEFPVDEEGEVYAKLEELVALANELRKELGLNPLYMVPVLNDAAYIRAKETAELYDHVRPDGSDFYTALSNPKFFFYAAAENLAAGLADVKGTHSQWVNSAKHYKNLVNPKYTHIGVGYYHEEGTEYGHYWEELFIGTAAELEGQYIPELYKVVPTTCGDIDGDGIVSNLDFVLLLKLFKKEVVLNDLQLESADCMKDGTITIADAIVLRKYILGAYDSIPRCP